MEIEPQTAAEERENSSDSETESTRVGTKVWLMLFNISNIFFLISETMTQIWTEADRLPKWKCCQPLQAHL
jgi:hypothetical protein